MLSSCCKTDPEYDHSHVPPGDTDIHFMQVATAASLSALSADSIALAKNGDSTVRQLARGTASVISAAQSDLLTIAVYYDITLPAASNVGPQKTLDTLAALYGHAFDSAYLRQHAVMTSSMISIFQNEVDHGIHQWVTRCAATYLPQLKDQQRITDSLLHARPW